MSKTGRSLGANVGRMFARSWVMLVLALGCGDDDVADTAVRGDDTNPSGQHAADATAQPPAPRACAGDDACANSAQGRLCDPWTHWCVECLSDGDCRAGELCIQRVCTPETRCESSLDCSLGAVCDGEQARCVECDDDRDCEGDSLCAAHACQPRCDSDRDCTAARMLCDRDAGHCAAPVQHAGSPDGGASGPDAGGPAPVACGGSIAVAAARVTPSVMLLLDGSTSMELGFGPVPDGGVPDPNMPAPGQPSRWRALRKALVDPVSGVLPGLQHSLRFGLAVFGTMPACPLPLGVIEPALGNASAIDGALPLMAPGQLTPTGAALDAVVDRLPDPVVSGPQLIVLVTDGDPNHCGTDIFAGGPTTDFAPSIAAAQKAQAKHIALRVVGMSTDVGVQHLQQMANLGAGLAIDAAPGAPVSFPADPAALVDALRGLLEAELSCDFALERAIAPGSECRGSVTLDGAQLACNGADGWKLLDPTHVRLQGSACAKLKAATAVLAASFPCTALQP